MSLNAFSREPPRSLDAEQAALGAAIISRTATERMLERLERVDFYLEAHRKIYDVIAYLDEKDQPADVTTVPVELQRRGQLESVGGVSYVIQLTDAVPTAAHVEHYCDLVEAKSTLRQLIDASNEIIAHSYEQEKEVPDIVDLSQRLMLGIGDRRATVWAAPAVIVDGVMSGIIDQAHQNPGVLTGLTELDRYLCGLQRQEFVVLAGRPGMGKTDLLLEFMDAACALDEPAPCGVFSLEMSKEALVQRLLRRLAKVDGMRIRERTVTPAEVSRLAIAGDRVRRWSFRIDAQAGLEPREIVARSRRMVREFGARLIFVDNLQRMELGDRPDTTHQKMSDAVRRFKDAAKDLDVTLIALSHLSRTVERRDDKRPMLSDLRESGSIEAEADIVLGMYRAMRYFPDAAQAHKAAEQQAGEPLAQEAEIGILKNRDGGGEGLWLKFAYWAAYGIFKGAAKHHSEHDAPPPRAYDEYGDDRRAGR